MGTPDDPRRPHAIASSPYSAPPTGPHLGVWHLRLAAAPNALFLRRDRRREEDEAGGPVAASVSDVLRLVAAARTSLRGPLALEIDGPGDPLASPETVLRSLALLREHHPDVLTGIVVDGPLLAEYAEDLADFGLRYIVLRLDAATHATARRLVDGALYRGEVFERDEAAELMVESGPQALRIARRHGIPTVVRFTLVPTVNAREVGAVAQLAYEAGAQRVDVVGHEPRPGSALARAGAPTPEELEDARAAVEEFAVPPEADAQALDWLVPERLQPVDTDTLEAVDVLRMLPAATAPVAPSPILPPRRAQLVAVATRDGSLVDTPLAATHLLRVYAVTENTIRLLGSRALPLDPRRRHDGVGEAQSFLQAVVGCRAVVATRIPERAVTLLQAVGIRPIAVGGTVEEVLDRVARGTVRQAEAVR